MRLTFRLYATLPAPATRRVAGAGNVGGVSVGGIADLANGTPRALARAHTILLCAVGFALCIYFFGYIQYSYSSNSFGIGLILLDTNNPDDSEILLEASQKDILDIEMMNKICQINPHFKGFLARIKTDLNSKEIRKEKFDKIFEPDEIIKMYQ